MVYTVDMNKVVDYKEFWVLAGMKRRCNNPNHEDYPYYGGRGIKVCDEWSKRGGFWTFYEHIGPRPSDSHTIDRVDNEKGYEPGNVKWVTRQEQANNRRTRKDNKVGVPGLNFHKPSGRWTYRKVINGKRVGLGYFDTLEEAMGFIKANGV